MPPIVGKNGRPLVQRIGSNIPFTKCEEKNHFDRIQDLIVEFNSRSERRITLTILGSDGSIAVVGTKSVVSTTLTSNIISKFTGAILENPDWFAGDNERDTFKVPVVHLPTPSELDNLDEAGVEGMISQFMNILCYPNSNHFGKNKEVPYCWPRMVAAKSPSIISMIADNKTGIKFGSRKAFLRFILEVSIFTYFYNLLFVKIGVIQGDTEESRFVKSVVFTTPMPFSTENFSDHTRDVLPCARKLSVLGRKMKTGKLPTFSSENAPSTEGDPAGTTEHSEQKVVITHQENSTPASEVQKLPSCDAQSAKLVRGMPFLRSYNAADQDDHRHQEGHRVFSVKVPRKLMVRKYRRRDEYGNESSSILCTCVERLNVAKINAIKCPCGNYNHVACVPNRNNMCVYCSLK